MKVIPSDSLLKNRKEKVSEKLCADCNSLCCHDLVMEISPPKNESELNTLKWYLHFRHSFIFIYENTWYHMIRSECRYLDKKTYLCKNYENRNEICSKHSPPKCERYEEWYDVIFDDQYELEKYVYENKIIKKKSSAAKKKVAKKNK